MYFYIVQILRNAQKQITGYKCLSRSLQPMKFQNVECVFVASDLLIDPDYVSIAEVDGKLVVSEDTTKKNSEVEIELRMKRIAFGQRLVAIMSIRNDAKNLSGAQIVQLVQDFSSINQAWLNGSIATSRALIDALTPDGTLLTSADKTAILAEIDGKWSELGYE